MQHTNQYQFNLIESTDAFSPAPLNENMEKVEAALEAARAEAAAANTLLSSKITRVALGTYTGTGTSGSEAPNSLTFEFEPKFLLIWTSTDTYRAMGLSGGNLVGYYSEKWGELFTTWSGNTVSWYAYVYSGDGSRPQMNSNGTTYSYLAIG